MAHFGVNNFHVFRVNNVRNYIWKQLMFDDNYKCFSVPSQQQDYETKLKDPLELFMKIKSINKN